MDPVVADDVIASRRQKIRSLVLPNCKPTAYSRDRRGSQTALNADQVERFRVPSQFSVVPADTVTAPALAAYEAYLASSDFPDALFADDGPINALVDAANALAGGPAPSGEAGVSHFLQVALFLILDLILSRFRPDQHERCWRFVGIGRTGKADWGLYLDGVLVFILKLKPHIIFSTDDMLRTIGALRRSGRLESAWANSRSKAEKIAFQVYAELSYDTAHLTAKYACVLNESYLSPSMDGEEAVQHSAGCLLFKRRADDIAVSRRVIRDDLEEPESRLQGMVETLLAFSLLDVEAYAPPPPPPRPPLPTQRQMRSHQDTAGGAGSGGGGDSSSSAHPSAGEAPDLRPSGRIANAHAPNTSLHRTEAEMLEQDAEDTADDMEISTSSQSQPSDESQQSQTRTAPSSSPPTLTEDVLQPGSSKTVYSSGPVSARLRFVVAPEAYPTELPSRVDPAIAAVDQFRRLQYPLPDGLDIAVSDTPSFVIERFAAEGALWTVYKGYIEGCPMPMAIKLCRTSAFPSEDDYSEEGGYGAPSATCALRNEYEMLRGPLRGLQPAVIPQVVAYYRSQESSGRETWLCVQEWGGARVQPLELFRREQLGLLRLYDRLHASGVLHNDVSHRNWVKQGTGPTAVRLVDFERSKTHEDVERDSVWGSTWESSCAAEIKNVRICMGLPI